MKVLIQRVANASVEIDGGIVAEISRGLLIFLGVFTDDRPEDAALLADKCAKLRIFDDPDGKMNLSLLDIGGEALIVSQFTLCADASRGRRPSYSAAARPETAIPLYEAFIRDIRRLGVARVETGRFGADMKIALINEGPVTISLDSRVQRPNVPKPH